MSAIFNTFAIRLVRKVLKAIARIPKCKFAFYLKVVLASNKITLKETVYSQEKKKFKNSFCLCRKNLIWKVYVMKTTFITYIHCK